MRWRSTLSTAPAAINVYEVGVDPFLEDVRKQDHSYTNNKRLSDADRDLDSGQMCISLVNDDEELDVPDVQNVWEDSYEISYVVSYRR